MSRFGNPVTQYLDDSGDPLVNGKLYFYATGTNTLLDTYADINLSIANTNPVILDASGRMPNVFLKNATYNVVLTKSDETQIWQRDPVGGESALGNFSTWNSLTIYSTNDIVEASDGKFYISITTANQGNDPTTSPANWTEIKFNQVWNSNQTYNTDDIVQGSDGTLYASLTDNNLNNDPVTDDINWQSASSLDIPDEILAAGYQFAYNNF